VLSNVRGVPVFFQGRNIKVDSNNGVDRIIHGSDGDDAGCDD
jgi:hypothetical protein